MAQGRPTSRRNDVYQVSKWNFRGYDFTGGRIFHFLLIFEWALQQCSATTLLRSLWCDNPQFVFFTVGWHKATSRSESMRGSKNTSWELWYIWSSTTCQLSTSHDVDRKDGNINDYAPRGFDSRNRTRPPAGCSSCAEHDVCGLVSICAGIRAISRRQRLVSVNHGVHRRKVHRHLPSDACADNVYGQPSQAHHRCVVVLRRHLLRTLARHYNHQV